ncbi:hypothetical protein AB7872_16635 [Rhodanobacter denitrificans]
MRGSGGSTPYSPVSAIAPKASTNSANAAGRKWLKKRSSRDRWRPNAMLRRVAVKIHEPSRWLG